MKKILFSLILLPFICLNSGCVPLIIGGAAGALGAYAVSKDTMQGDFDKTFDSLWDAASDVARNQGTVKEEDIGRGFLKLEINASKVDIYIIRLTQKATRLRVSARKNHLPNLSLAQDIFTKIIEGAK